MPEQQNGIAEAIKHIESLAKASVNFKPEILPLPGERPGTYALIVPGAAGEKLEDRYKIVTAGPLWHNERLKTPAEIVAFIESLKARKKVPGEAVVYIGDELISFHYSFEDRRDRATVELSYSQPWLFLTSGCKEMTQRELIKLLRITFDGCLLDQGSLLSRVRNLKFDNQGNVTSNLQHGNEAIGKSVLNQISGLDTLPDEFTLQLRVYENYNQTVNVRVALELIPEKGRFEVVAFPNQLEIAQRETLGWIRDLFTKTTVPAFVGKSRPERD